MAEPEDVLGAGEEVNDDHDELLEDDSGTAAMTSAASGNSPNVAYPYNTSLRVQTGHPFRPAHNAYGGGGGAEPEFDAPPLVDSVDGTPYPISASSLNSNAYSTQPPTSIPSASTSSGGGVGDSRRSWHLPGPVDEAPAPEPATATTSANEPAVSAPGPNAALEGLLKKFWEGQVKLAEKDTDPETGQSQAQEWYKHPQLPLARIKKVMKSDPDVKMIGSDAPLLFSKACEIFVTEVTARAWLIASQHKRRTLSRAYIARALAQSDQFDFLIDIVPRELQHERSRPGASKDVDADDDEDYPGAEYFNGDEGLGTLVPVPVPMSLGEQETQPYYGGDVGGGLYVESYAREGATSGQQEHMEPGLERAWGDHDREREPSQDSRN